MSLLNFDEVTDYIEYFISGGRMPRLKFSLVEKLLWYEEVAHPSIIES